MQIRLTTALNKFNTLLDINIPILDINIPILHKIFKTYSKHHKPWIKDAIIHSILRKKFLYGICLKKTPAARDNYKYYKNKLTNVV